MFTGSYYVAQANNMIGKITGGNYKVDKMVVAVRADDSAETIEDAAGYTYGVQFEKGADNIQTAVTDIEKQIGVDTIEVKEYDSVQAQAQALIDGDCDAIIYNSAYTSLMEEAVDGYSEKAKVLYTFNIRVELNLGNKDSMATDDSITKEPFTVYISGIDVYGDVSETSRSDVNIVLTVNARTKQVLMISTPRDYYVPLSISNGVPDKLTHAGIYGINVCMDTLNMLYDTDINYYFRLNFAGFVQIIDALGGITVDSDYDFTTQNSSGYHFTKGPNQVNGDQALAFCRERYAFSAGDRQRGKDQMKVIQGVINKATSPDILKNYLSLLDSLSGCFETNIPYDVITSLVKQQLDEGGSWQVLSYSVDGTGDTQKPYSMSQKAYVMVPDQTTVDKAKTLMQKVRQGFMLSEADVSAQ